MNVGLPMDVLVPHWNSMHDNDGVIRCKSQLIKRLSEEQIRF